MKTNRSARRNPLAVIALLLLSAAWLAPRAALATPPGTDDATRVDVPDASFGAETAQITEPAGNDEVSYGPHATFALELPAADEALATNGHDDVAYPAAEPGRASEPAVAVSRPLVAAGNAEPR